MTLLVIAFLLVFFRVAGFVAFLPPFSGRHLPHTVKIGLATALTVMWSTKVVPPLAFSLNPEISDNWFLLTWLAVRETLFGASLGWLLGLVLVPMRIAGAYIIQEMGLTMAAVTSATEPSESNVLSQVFEIIAILLLFGTNIHHEFLRLFDSTLELFPLGKSWTLPSQEWIVGSILQTTNLGLGIAAPVGIVLFVSLVATMFMMRQSPQFNLFTFGGPIRLFIGLVAMLWFLPSMMSGMMHTLHSFTSFRGL
ncbi:flagellar biosynthetic protein FliR [Planctomicrobium sp. SH668]|uniref:flagellar biosynthetic protein FliR n=1 Tax=Planctomicrobium sp. SH668 TaxID=3448126 RepID=UPI003F5C799F